MTHTSDVVAQLSARRWNEDNCAQEPIHIPGLVQAFGVLALVCARTRRILQISDNASDVFGRTAEEVLGSDLSDIFAEGGDEALRLLFHRGVTSQRVVLKSGLGVGMGAFKAGRNAGTGATSVAPATALGIAPRIAPGIAPGIATGIATARSPADAVTGDGTTTILIQCHRTSIQDEFIVEFLREPTTEESAAQSLLSGGVLQRLSRAFSGSHGLLGVAQRIADEVRQVTGFDRVKLYRFDEEWNGEVIAEARADDTVDSYLGLKFPVSDIPAQARAMLLDNWVRVIPDVDAPAARLVPTLHPHTSRPLDMGRALLRNPSQIHLEYLRNMGVRSTLTVTLKVNGRLWGLIACHHHTALHVPTLMRDMCETVGQMFSTVIAPLLMQEQESARRANVLTLERLRDALRMGDRPARSLVSGRPSLVDLMEGATSAAVFLDGRWAFVGQVPKLDELSELIAWLRKSHEGEDVFSTRCLSGVFPPAARYKSIASGLLALPLTKSMGHYVLWFRPQASQTVTWAGEPSKVERGTGKDMTLHPRRSFVRWVERLQGTSVPWSDVDFETARDLKRVFTEVDLERRMLEERNARSETDRERGRAEFLARAGILLQENLDTRAVLESFSRLVTMGFCDWCVLEFRGELPSGASRVIVSHASQQGRTLIEVFKDFAIEGRVFSPLGEELSLHPETQLMAFADPPFVRSLCVSPMQADFLERHLCPRSIMLVPLELRGERLGTIVFALSESMKRYDESDRALAIELGRRVASAIDNARLFERVREANDAKEIFLSTVSHDLKNPLNLVSINASMLKRLHKNGEGPLRDAALNGIEGIEKASKRMQRLISDLLDLAKMDSGTLPIQMERESLGSLLRDAFDMFEPLAREKGVFLNMPSDAADTEVLCDRERTLQVLSNLLGNALKFTPAGGCVTVRTRSVGTVGPIGTIGTQGPDACERIEIEDTGPGIPLEMQSHVFEKFWQAKDTARKGTGLGLAIAKGIVEAQQGHIWVTSQPGRGACFTFTLPLAPRTPRMDHGSGSGVGIGPFQKSGA